MEKIRETLSRNNVPSGEHWRYERGGKMLNISHRWHRRRRNQNGNVFLPECSFCETRDWWSGPSGRDGSDALTLEIYKNDRKIYRRPTSPTPPSPPQKSIGCWQESALTATTQILLLYHCQTFAKAVLLPLNSVIAAAAAGAVGIFGRYSG